MIYRRSIFVMLVLIAVLTTACAGVASVRDGGDTNGDNEALLGNLDQAAPSAGAVSAERLAFDDSLRPYDANGGPVSAENQLIIRTGSLTLIVNDVLSATDAARTTIEGMGGRLAASQASGGKEDAYATITYRVPAARFDDAVKALSALAIEVRDARTDSSDVTTQVVDLGARLENLKVTEKALQGIMDQATKIPDILAVQEQLTQVRGEIERLTAEKLNLEDQAAISTLSATFAVEVPESQIASEEWDAGKTIDAAVSQLIGLGQGVATLLINLVIVGLPLALLLGVLGLIGFAIYRFVRRLRAPHAA